VQRSIVVALRGGLGNQLFQYASGFGVAHRLGAELFFDSERVREPEHWLPELLGVEYREASRSQLLQLGVMEHSARLTQRAAAFALRRGVAAARRLRGLTPAVAVFETPDGTPHGIYEDVYAIDLPTYLLAFLHSEQYFAHVSVDVVRNLRFPTLSLPRPEPSRPVVALSFRRGDYVRLGWDLPLSYYERALARMLREVPDASFLVFGDDPLFVHLVTDWVTRYGPATNAYDLADGPLEQMALAAQCDHALIANSTFAWWGAWLGDQRSDERRTVIAPQMLRDWDVDILPDRWIVVASD
jgi:hypothetical protein